MLVHILFQAIVVYLPFFLSPFFILKLIEKFLVPRPGKLAQGLRVIIAWVSVNMIIQISDPVNILYTLPFFCLSILFLYQGALDVKCTMILVLYPMMMASNALWYCLCILIPFVFQNLLTFLFWGILWLLIRKVLPDAHYTLSHQTWMLMSMLSILPMAATLASVILNQSEDLMLSIAILPFAVFSSVVLLLSVAIFTKQEYIAQENQLYQLRSIYWSHLEEEQLQLRRLRHDLRNHFAALQGFLLRGDTIQAQTYLEDLTEAPGMLSGQHFCDNETVNIVLSSKVPEIQAANIQLHLDLALPSKLPFSAPALCSLLANALDNAYEACCKIPSSQTRAISLQARVCHGQFMLRVTNTYRSIETDSQGNLRTSKTDTKTHGFGLRNMQSIPQEYHGVCDIQTKRQIFALLFSCPADP